MSSQAPLAIVTCGPAHSPIDAVRLLTNVSTGSLGHHLCKALSEKGWDVLCFKGHLATAFHEPPPPRVTRLPFTTNASLLRALQELPNRSSVRAVFHAAALTDFDVASITTPDNRSLTSHKISSDCPELILRLKPALKLLPELAPLFPRAKIVGWKYELEGTREDALQRAALQLQRHRGALCVVNGNAFGLGFGVLSPEGTLIEQDNRETLSRWLADWAQEQLHP